MGLKEGRGRGDTLIGMEAEGASVGATHSGVGDGGRVPCASARVLVDGLNSTNVDAKQLVRV